MEVYFFPIKVAFVTFPVIAFMVTLPLLIIQYQKYGYVNKFRAIILYSFLLYIIVAYYLIILPLPKTRDVASIQRPGTIHYNLKPFKAVDDIIKETKIKIADPGTYKYILTERAFLQLFFNAILLLPLGVYLRYYFRKSFKETLVISFLVSLFFEITQLTGLYGIYNAPYRLFDVDDLMLNTLGGAIGYGITPMFAFFLPDTESLDDNIDIANLQVGYLRRFVTYMIDMSLIGLIPRLKDNILLEIGVFAVYFILIPYLSNGRTLGCWLTNIRIKGREEKISFKEILIRNGSLYFGVSGLNHLMTNLITFNEATLFSNFMIVVVFFQLGFNIFIGIHGVYTVLKKNLFFYEKMSGTHMVVSK